MRLRMYKSVNRMRVLIGMCVCGDERLSVAWRWVMELLCGEQMKGINETNRTGGDVLLRG